MVNLINKSNKEAQFKPKDTKDTGMNFKAENEDIEIGTDKRVKLNRYYDIEGVTLGKLRIGYWIVRNKRNFLSLFMGFLLVLIVISWGSYVFTFGKYIFIDMKADKASVDHLLKNNLISFAELSRKGAIDVIKYSPEVIRTGGKYDFIARIENPNPDHYAHFEYSFETNSGKYGQGTGFILPNEKKHLLSLGQEIAGNVGQARLVFDKIYWQRVDKRKIIDWRLYAADRLNIYTDEEKFIPGQSSGLSEKIILNRLNFIAHNSTAYNYYSVGFNIILVSNNREIAAYRHDIDRFMSGTDEFIDLTLPYNIGNVDKVLIEPVIDISSDEIYIDIGEKYGNTK